MISITDNSGNVLAVVDVTEYAPNKYKGEIISSNFPESLSLLISEFEECVDSQIFSLIDEIQGKIETYGLTFAPTGKKIHDLQVFQTNLISFQIKDKT